MMHLKSMTGFGRAVADSEWGTFEVEIQGVNRRFLEINFFLPLPFSSFESHFRKLISEWVGRGQVTFSLIWKNKKKQNINLNPDFELAKALKEAYVKIAEYSGVKPDISLEMIVRQPDILSTTREKEDVGQIELLEELTSKALKEFILSKEKEGTALAQDFDLRLKEISEFILKIEKESKGSVEKYREKLSSRMKEIFAIDDERILKEIALYAEKVDITEECVRFKAHLQAFSDTLKSVATKQETKGKRLEFLIQELFREINTIGSKSLSIEIARWVVDAKCSLEKMKEQVQNIE